VKGRQPLCVVSTFAGRRLAPEFLAYIPAARLSLGGTAGICGLHAAVPVFRHPWRNSHALDSERLRRGMKRLVTMSLILQAGESIGGYGAIDN